MTASKLVVASLVLSLNIVGSHAGLKVGFYKGKCNTTDVEATIKSLVTTWYNKDKTIAPALLRMLFHDCFIRGCDASLLLDGAGTEKTASPNRSVRGYDLIDKIKATLEKACPAVVSCSDIISLATRDVVALNGGSTYNYEVPTGRRDGNISKASEAIAGLPTPTISVPNAITLFSSKGFNTNELVLLMGTHTVGVTHCSVIFNRIYNYNGAGHSDPTLNSTLLSALKARCSNPPSSIDYTVNLDQETPTQIDNIFYQQIINDYAILPIDEALWYSKSTYDKVKSLAKDSSFPNLFAKGLIKLGSLDLLTGNQGKIRTTCGSP